MKITVIALFACICTLFASDVYSQNVKVSISANNFSLLEVIREIEKQTDYLFVYDRNEVNVNRPVSLHTDNEPVPDVLNKIFVGTGVEYKLIGKNITLIKHRNFPVESRISQQSPEKVTGTITDERGEPLIGANVVEKGTSNGVITDVDGKYSLSISSSGILIISYMGFLPQEIPVSGQRVINISLRENVQEIEQVVVVGYGTRKKSSLTTAVSSVSGEELITQSSTDLRKSLQGMIPGLTILDNGGDPGSFNMQMQIRGVSSPNGSSPLILIDGQVFDSLNNLDPNTVSSVSILKDAASTAIYGSRGANGIILITTKTGEKGKIKISYDGSIGWQRATVLPEFMTTEEFLNWRNDLAYFEKQRNPSSSLPTYTPEDIQDYLLNMKTNPVNHRAASYDMEDLYRPNVSQTKHSLTLGGGGDFVRSLFNISYYHQEGLIKNRTYERISFRSNNDFNLAKNFKGHVNVYYEHSKRERQASGHAEYEIVQGIHNPTAKWGLGGAPFYDEEGNYIPNAARRRNALLLTDIDYTGLHTISPDLGSVDFGLEWEPVKGLKLSVNYAHQKTWHKEEKNVPRWKLDFQEYKTNSLWYRDQQISRATLNGLIAYDKSMKEHTINAMLGYSTEEYKNEYRDMYGQDFFNNELRNISTGSQDNFSLTNSLNEWGLRSFFGRVAYNYADRYYLEGSLRSDGSSRFPKENRYSLFPGVSVGWRISNEKFWEPLEAIVPNLKLRYSYGQAGSHDGIGNYSYIPQLTVGQYYDFAAGPNNEYAVNTVRQTNLASTELSWEKVIQNDFGIDLSFLSSRLNATFDYFTKTTDGVLLDLAIPKAVGLNPAKTNAGKVENKGWELDISWRDAIEDFNYTASFGISYVKNELVDYAGLGITQVNDMYYRWESSPIYALRGYKVIGIIQNEEEASRAPKIAAYASQVGPGDYLYEDVNGDGKIDWDNDAQYIGKKTPSYTYNIRFTANWKDFDFAMFWNGVADVETYLAGYLGEGGAYNNAPNSKFVRNNYWKKEGDTNVHFGRPLFRESNNLMERGYSSAFVFDAGYLRLKSLTLGYTIPQNLTRKIKTERIRIYFEGTNLLTLSKFMRNWGLDPEDVPVSDAWTGLDGANSNAKRHIYPPQLKSYNVGLSIQF